MQNLLKGAQIWHLFNKNKADGDQQEALPLT